MWTYSNLDWWIFMSCFYLNLFFVIFFDSFTRSLWSSGMDFLTDFKAFTAIFPTFRNFLVFFLVGLWSTPCSLNTTFVSGSPWQFMPSSCKPVGLGWYGTVHIRHRQFGFPQPIGFPQPTILSVGKFWFRPILDPSSLLMSFINGSKSQNYKSEIVTQMQ